MTKKLYYTDSYKTTFTEKIVSKTKYFDKFANGYYPSINVEKSHNIDAPKKRLKFM